MARVPGLRNIPRRNLAYWWRSAAQPDLTTLVIMKPVIYVTLDIRRHNVPRPLTDPALSLVLTGKPITSGVVAFYPGVGTDTEGQCRLLDEFN